MHQKTVRWEVASQHVIANYDVVDVEHENEGRRRPAVPALLFLPCCSALLFLPCCSCLLSGLGLSGAFCFNDNILSILFLLLVRLHSPMHQLHTSRVACMASTLPRHPHPSPMARCHCRTWAARVLISLFVVFCGLLWSALVCFGLLLLLSTAPYAMHVCCQG